MTSFKRLLTAVWLLNAYDAAITVYVTQCLNAIELNPIMAACLDSSVFLFLAVKLLSMTAICWILFRRFKRSPQAVRTTLWVLFGLYWLVCAWNTSIVFW